MQYLRCLCLLFFLCFENGYAQNVQTKYIIIDTLVDARTSQTRHNLKEFWIIGINDSIFVDIYDKVIISDNTYSLRYKHTEIVVTFSNKGMLGAIRSTELDSINVCLFFDDAGSNISLKNINLSRDTIHITKWEIIDNNLPQIDVGYLKYYTVFDSSGKNNIYNTKPINDTIKTTNQKEIKNIVLSVNKQQFIIPVQVMLSKEFTIKHYHGYPNRRHRKRHYMDKFPHKCFWGRAISKQFIYQGELTFTHQ